MWFYLNYSQQFPPTDKHFLRWDIDAQSVNREFANYWISRFLTLQSIDWQIPTTYMYTFYKLQNLTNAKFEFNSLLGLAGQIHLLVLHPERIKKQNQITTSKQYTIQDQQTVQSKFIRSANSTICLTSKQCNLHVPYQQTVQSVIHVLANIAIYQTSKQCNLPVLYCMQR